MHVEMLRDAQRLFAWNLANHFPCLRIADADDRSAGCLVDAKLKIASGAAQILLDLLGRFREGFGESGLSMWLRCRGRSSSAFSGR